ncbi:MAG: hypothetical protein MUF00_02845 [Gemmatimonadaceae bacterium]|jgi:hypothetical protein|nr:hypothetical protein [Gemmatimonadaceae bacterium]
MVRSLIAGARVSRSRLFVVAALWSLAACGGKKVTSAPAPVAPKNSTPAGAIDGFLAAAKARDLVTMGALWGTDKGSARDQMKADELEKRLVIVQCKVDHSSWKFVEDRPRMPPATRTGTTAEFGVELRIKDAAGGRDISARTTIVTVVGPEARWYVQSVDMAPLGEFCR